ncbi:MAG: hypothetical protein JXA11_06765 [Phycisphaerae bacterium]|nr:hypothetical protein [Phycisphaerae bacterium]
MTSHEPQPEEPLAAWHGCMNGEDTPPDDAEPLTTEQRRQLADEQLLHALLRGRYCDTEASAAKLVDRVLHAITPRPARPLWFRLVRATLSSAAAMVLVVILIELSLPRTSSATSDYDRVLSAFMTEGDRTYSLQYAMQSLNGDAETEETPAAPHRPPMRPRGPGRLHGAKLYLRGGNQYVFEIQLPREKTLWIGQDGRNAWAVRPQGAVLFSEERDAFHLPFFEEMTTLPLIDMRDTLHAAKNGYVLDPPKRVTMDDGRGAEYFLARRNQQAARRPQRIEIWADPQSGLLYRVVFSRMHFGQTLCRQLRMEYLNGKPLPENWFTYQAHAPANANVKTVTKQDIRRYHHRRDRMRPHRQPPRQHHRQWEERRTPPPPVPDSPPPGE